MSAHPELIGYEQGATDTDLMRLRPGWIAKGGAEGLICAASPDGLGVALKVEDGNMRGLRPALARFLDLGEDFARSPVTNMHGEEVGLDHRVKVHIISDIEGCAGIVKWEQTGGDSPLYEEGRKLYTEEINAAVRGARRRARPRSSSWTATARPARSLQLALAEDLDPACEFVVQEQWTGYTASSRQAATRRCSSGCTRAPARREGVLNHTVSGTEWRTLPFNGVEVGETGINAALCGTGAARSCSSRATPSPATRVASCSATASPRSPSSRARAASAPATSRRSAPAS